MSTGFLAWVLALVRLHGLEGPNVCVWHVGRYGERSAQVPYSRRRSSVAAGLAGRVACHLVVCRGWQRPLHALEPMASHPGYGATACDFLVCLGYRARRPPGNRSRTASDAFNRSGLERLEHARRR